MAESTGIALGMIETRGLVPAIEAADAMTKAAELPASTLRWKAFYLRQVN
jgi:hypothetical protein